MFRPFRPTEKQEISLAQAKLKSNTELLSFQRGDQRRTFIAAEMAYHHIGQGVLAGQPYLVTF